MCFAVACVPCHPILSMIGSAQHELAKFLAALLQPVLELYLTNCISDSFSFAKMIQQLEVNSNDSNLCLFDICSLFINIPLAETIEFILKHFMTVTCLLQLFLNIFLLN